MCQINMCFYVAQYKPKENRRNYKLTKIIPKYYLHSNDESLTPALSYWCKSHLKKVWSRFYDLVVKLCQCYMYMSFKQILVLLRVNRIVYYTLEQVTHFFVGFRNILRENISGIIHNYTIEHCYCIYCDKDLKLL